MTNQQLFYGTTLLLRSLSLNEESPDRAYIRLHECEQGS